MRADRKTTKLNAAAKTLKAATTSRTNKPKPPATINNLKLLQQEEENPQYTEQQYPCPQHLYI
jgi:hypothetical protein